MKEHDWKNGKWKENKRVIQAKEKLEDTRVRNILTWTFQIVVTLAFAALVAIMMFQSVTMQESSMEPTLSVGERFFVNRLSYRVSDPERGDLIVFRTNASDEAALHIRRVIGLPGETVQIKDGQIFINGDLYEEGKGFPEMNSGGIAEKPVTLKSGEYFVLGDNRNNSEDSRHGDIGLVNKKYIEGKLWFTISPLREIGFLKG